MYYIRKKLLQTMKDLIHKVVKNSKQNISKSIILCFKLIILHMFLYRNS